MKIKIEAIVYVDDNLYPIQDKEEKEWFENMMNDKYHTMLLLWSNDIGDEIGSTNMFKWEIIKEDGK